MKVLELQGFSRSGLKVLSIWTLTFHLDIGAIKAQNMRLCNEL